VAQSIHRILIFTHTGVRSMSNLKVKTMNIAHTVMKAIVSVCVVPLFAFLFLRAIVKGGKREKSNAPLDK
jgi:hypothetical protein